MNEQESIPSFEIAEFRYLADIPATVVSPVLAGLRLRGFQTSRDALYHPEHWKVLSAADAAAQGLTGLDAYRAETEAFVPVSDDAKAWLAGFRGGPDYREPDRCRRCSECPDSDHHWIEGGPADDCPHGFPEPCEECIAEAPAYACKHCPATASYCDPCMGDGCEACGLTGVVENLPPGVPESHRLYYLTAVNKMSLPRSSVLEAVRQSVKEDEALAKLECPGCGGAITKTRDPRQAGPSSNNGTWYNYRCAGCRYAIDKAEAD